MNKKKYLERFNYFLSHKNANSKNTRVCQQTQILRRQSSDYLSLKSSLEERMFRIARTRTGFPATGFPFSLITGAPNGKAMPMRSTYISKEKVRLDPTRFLSFFHPSF